MLLFLLSIILVYHGVLITLNFSDGCDTINWEALEQVCIITLFMYLYINGFSSQSKSSFAFLHSFMQLFVKYCSVCMF